MCGCVCVRARGCTWLCACVCACMGVRLCTRASMCARVHVWCRAWGCVGRRGCEGNVWRCTERREVLRGESENSSRHTRHALVQHHPDTCVEQEQRTAVHVGPPHRTHGAVQKGSSHFPPCQSRMIPSLFPPPHSPPPAGALSTSRVAVP